MRTKTIDLRSKTIAQARRIMKRLVTFKNEQKINVHLNFLLPNRDKAKKRDINMDERIKGKCPYCQSPLTETEAGIVCTSKNMRDIIFDIEQTRRKHGDKANLFLSNKANRFYDYYMLMGKDMTCDYIQGNEERRFRINNRILRPGVDRKKIFGGGK